MPDNHSHHGHDNHDGSIDANLLDIAKSLRKIVEFLRPKPATKATRVAISIDQEVTTMSQFHIGVEGCRATLTFNGVIDGEPTITNVGVGTLTVDPKIETPSPTNPVLLETKVVCHLRNGVAGAVGFQGLAGSALADNPDTADLEAVLIDFPEVCEWIPPTQAKANAVSIDTVSEPI